MRFGFFMACVWMLAACGHSHQQLDALFDRAESVMNVHPDSAFTWLDGLHERMAMNQSQTARYALLLTRAANKTFEPLSEPPYDSLLNIALQEYDKPSIERSIALLYRGRVRMEQQHWQGAMSDLQEAYRLIQTYPQEREYHRHVLSSLSGVYQVLGFDDEAFETTREFAGYCQADIDKSVVYSQMGDYFNNHEMPDSALYYQRLAYHLAQRAGDENLSTMYAHRIGDVFLYMEHYDSALIFLNYPGHPAYLDGRIGQAFHYNGQEDSAYHYLKKYVESDLDVKEIEPFKLLYEVEKERGELANAYRHLEASMLLADSLVSAHDNSGDITSLMVAHREEMATHIQQAKAKEERIMLTSGFIVLALLAYSVYLQRLRRKDLKLKDTINKLLEKDRIIFDNQQQIEEYDRSIAGLNKEKQLLQNWMLEQTPIFKKVKQLSLQDFTKPYECKVLSYKEQKELKTTLFGLCASYVGEMRSNYPRLEDDDILLLCLKKYTDFDANTVALCFGTTSKHTINQRRYRMKERLNNA